MKNFQMTINILSNKGDNEKLNVDDPSEQTTQNISLSSRLFLKMINKNKIKGKDIKRKESQTSRRIP